MLLQTTFCRKAFTRAVDGSDEEKTITLTGPDVDPVDGTLTVDLLALSGGQLSQLFNNETVTAGSYQWVRFGLVDGTSKIVWDDDTESPLQLPANKNELKTSGSFSVNADESVAYIIDWDLRKSIVERNASSGSEYMLKPVLHIKRDDVYAYATGTTTTLCLTAVGRKKSPASMYSAG